MPEPEIDAIEKDSGGMLEQHLSALKRAFDSGDMARAAHCFRAAIAEADAPDEAEEPDNDEGY